MTPSGLGTHDAATVSGQVQHPSTALGTRHPARNPDLLCALGLVAFSTLLFADVLFFGDNFHFRDLYTYHMPLKWIVRDTIAHGQLPLWNPYIAGGQPMAANPAYEVFYPLQWLTLLGSFSFGFALHIVAHVWLALLGMYALLRALPLRLTSSLFGALSFGLGGLLTGAVTNLPTFFAWAWAPIIGLALLRLVREPGARRFAVAAIVAAMPLLVAEPVALLQIWFMLLVVTLAYARRRLGVVLAVAATSALVAAVQLVPMFDLVANSSRARGFSYDLVVDWSMPPARPLELFLPRVFGLLNSGRHAFWGTALWPRGGPYLLSIYAGALVAILAAAGFVTRVRGARVTAAIALTSYLLAIGGHTPLFAWLYRIGIRFLRYPEKFVAMGVVALIVFAATVADRFLASEARVQRVARLTAWSVTALLAAWALITLTPPFDNWFLALWGQPLQLQPLASIARTTTMIAAGVAFGWAAILTAYARGHERLARIAGLLLLLADLGTFQRETMERMPAAYFTAPQIVQAFDRTADVALFHRGEWTQKDEIARYGAVSNAWLSRNALRPYVPARWGLRTVLQADLDETALSVTHDLLDAMKRLGSEGFPRWSEPFMTISGAGYVLDYRPAIDALREAEGHAEVWRPVRIRRVPAEGRYWFARALIPARSQDELLAAFRRLPDVRGDAFVPWPPFSPAPGLILRTRERANDVEWDVESAGNALLVVTITRDVHWQAAIDGTPAPLLPANVAYQAVVIPPGPHHVELHYHNPLIAIGAVISLLTVIVMAGAVLITGSRKSVTT
jgi:hypothetical protein